jgi:hypothetical protein
MVFLKKSYMALALLFFLFTGGWQTALSQLPQGQIDSLEKLLGTAREDTNKVKLLMNLGNNVGYADANKA